MVPALVRHDERANQQGIQSKVMPDARIGKPT
jgi:hypothetical protein